MESAKLAALMSLLLVTPSLSVEDSLAVTTTDDAELKSVYDWHVAAEGIDLTLTCTVTVEINATHSERDLVIQFFPEWTFSSSESNESLALPTGPMDCKIVRPYFKGVAEMTPPLEVSCSAPFTILKIQPREEGTYFCTGSMSVSDQGSLLVHREMALAARVFVRGKDIVTIVITSLIGTIIVLVACICLFFRFAGHRFVWEQPAKAELSRTEAQQRDSIYWRHRIGGRNVSSFSSTQSGLYMQSNDVESMARLLERLDTLESVSSSGQQSSQESNNPLNPLERKGTDSKENLSVLEETMDETCSQDGHESTRDSEKVEEKDEEKARDAEFEDSEQEEKPPVVKVKKPKKKISGLWLTPSHRNVSSPSPDQEHHPDLPRRNDQEYHPDLPRRNDQENHLEHPKRNDQEHHPDHPKRKRSLMGVLPGGIGIGCGYIADDGIPDAAVNESPDRRITHCDGKPGGRPFLAGTIANSPRFNRFNQDAKGPPYMNRTRRISAPACIGSSPEPWLSPIEIVNAAKLMVHEGKDHSRTSTPVRECNEVDADVETENEKLENGCEVHSN